MESRWHVMPRGTTEAPTPPTVILSLVTARALNPREETIVAPDESKLPVILSEGWGAGRERRIAALLVDLHQDLCGDPSRGWFWTLDDVPPTNPHKTYEFPGSERVGARVGAKDLRADGETAC